MTEHIAKKAGKAMTIAHRLTGYDKMKENLVFTHAIPNAIPKPQLLLAIDIAAVPRSDRDATGVYPLTKAEQSGEQPSPI